MEDHVQSVPREVAHFLQSRLGELSVSEADAAYPRYLEALRLGPRIVRPVSKR